MNTLYFYDLETSGFDPKQQRVMQFAGQRTDMELNPIGEPHNVLIKLSEDILPDPDAVMVTGITPQSTFQEGLTEAEFLKLFTDEVAIPGTIFTGFNTIRFDDEFMRYMHYRNFYDPYEWQWRDDRSKWDLLDMVRMTRALRPEGINWPFNSEGKPTNNLVDLATVNKLEHTNAHDALSDVLVTIDLAKLIRSKQPKLFDYLLKIRSKKECAKLVTSTGPFIYTSGKYTSDYEKTAIVIKVAAKDDQSALVYDLRHDPKQFEDFTPEQLAEAMSWKKRGDEGVVLPVKTIKYNRCPAIAPMTVLNDESKKRLDIDMSVVTKNLETLNSMTKFEDRLIKAIEILDKKQQARLFADEASVDGQLYDGFFGDGDKKVNDSIRAAKPDEIIKVGEGLKDERLKNLLPLYKARNYPSSLSGDERQAWEKYCNDKLFAGGQDSRLAKFFSRIEEIKNNPLATDKQKYLLTDLELYGQSLLPDF